MRFEINVPDSAPSAIQRRIGEFARRISEKPELIDDVYVSSSDLFELSPKQLQVVRESQAEFAAGNFYTIEELEAALEEDKAAWRAANG